MKSCPTCETEYADDSLEFCLQDGTRLATAARPQKSTVRQVDQPTIAFTGAQPPAAGTAKEVETVVRQGPFQDRPAVQPRAAALEYAPLVLALAHNWWQWLYVQNQYVYSVIAYISSANFLMWLLLLALAVGASLFSLKALDKKGIAYTSLVVLAVNLILFAVPRR